MTHTIKPGDRVRRVIEHDRLLYGKAVGRWANGYEFTAHSVDKIKGIAIEKDDGYQFHHKIDMLEKVQPEPVTGIDNPSAVAPGKALRIDYADGSVAYALISHVIPAKPPAPSVAASLPAGERIEPKPQGPIRLNVYRSTEDQQYAAVDSITSGKLTADDLRECAHYFNQVAEWLDWANTDAHNRRVTEYMIDNKPEHRETYQPHKFTADPYRPMICINCGCNKNHPVHS